jgi:hypothetical protein
MTVSFLKDLVQAYRSDQKSFPLRDDFVAALAGRLLDFLPVGKVNDATSR